MPSQHKAPFVIRREFHVIKAEEKAQAAFHDALKLCRDKEPMTFFELERRVAKVVAILACCFLELFLVCRQSRCKVRSYLRDHRYRRAGLEERTIKTAYGPVTYRRHYLAAKRAGCGIHPLDIELALPRDGFSPWVIQWVSWLATQVSYRGAYDICRQALGWSPSTETIEHLVLGLGRQAAPYIEQAPQLQADGEVLVIEIDGKCTPTATDAELVKRRGKRQARPCACGCQRHRGRDKRQPAWPRKRRKKGDKSKHGREVMLVVMYTLRRGTDGRLHGPINKQTWGSYAGRQAAADWARGQATRRGFPPETTKTVQIVLDGAKGLKQKLQPLFPQAVFTLDACHVEEKLWKTGRVFHLEGSRELQDWVQCHLEKLFGGEPHQVVDRLKQQLAESSPRGPGSKARRKALNSAIGYLERRLDMMCYAQWQAQDLVLASGHVEGAARHVVGLRMDGSGMRWIPGRAEPLLHLRCIAINRDWQRFFQWAHDDYHRQLQRFQKVQIRTNELLPVKLAS